MDTGYTLKEYWYFIKDNLKLILITTLVVLAAFIGYQLLPDNTEVPENIEVATEQIEYDEELMQEYLLQDFDDLREEQQSLLIDYLATEAFVFEFYIEDENQKPYTQFQTLKEMLTTEDVVASIEETSGYSIQPDSKRGIILGLESGTNLIEVKVATGDAEANQAIASAYYAFLTSDEFSFLENKRVYFIDEEPRKIDLNESTEPEQIAPTTSQNGTFVVMLFLAIIAGAILGLIIAFVKLFMSKRISYLYDYNVHDDIKIYKFLNNKHYEDKEVAYAMMMPLKESYLILSEEVIEQEEIEKLEEVNEHNPRISAAQDISDFPAATQQEKNVVVLIKSNKTTKNWYKLQQRKLDLINVPYRIIQL